MNCSISIVLDGLTSQSLHPEHCISWGRVLVKSSLDLQPLDIEKCILSENRKVEGKAKHKGGVTVVGFCEVILFFPEQFIK